MKHAARSPLLFVLLALLGAGCSALPGLRVLTGQDAPDAVADRVVETTGLVMADKSGNTDPSIIAAADRIEAAANGQIDIIEIREDPANDVFNIYMLFNPDLGQNATAQEQNDALRRALELAWQGTLSASQGADIIRVNMLQPGVVPTLDKGLAFYAQIAATFEISREKALSYLAKRPTTLQDFANLIVDGEITYQTPASGERAFYESQPNHPMFMLASLEAQARAQSSGSGQ
ncbi:MAG: hypothetical protein HZC41_26295 [Chloroflexi bacterium]|nr:hypothetical protein [Chloroflexota bacterium]